MVAVCCLLVVDGGVLSVACDSLFILACCALFVVCCLLLVVCWLLCTRCCLLLGV